MQKGNIKKYKPYRPIDLLDRQWPSRTVEKPPYWCSVDLRDGNQALAIPMTVEEKLEYFQLLVDIGFKQIEIGFPSAADTEFDFCRKLIEDKLIPDDVHIQVLTQAREHLIKRTFEALDGAANVIVHLYNSTSPLQRKVTFRNASKDEIKSIAVEGTKLVRELANDFKGKITFQYSPESFSDTELEFSFEVCEAVMEVWKPTANDRVILNLPATVEWFTPNIHADQIEWFCRELDKKGNRDKTIISLHTHNDRGTGTAATELGMLAGADRVEGTLFGNGERTGNLDIVTVALNLYSQGIDPKLNFDDLQSIREAYERLTRMTVHERHPYGGDLVFTAFSGSHQDAVKKGMDLRKDLDDPNSTPWEVPYLTIDPDDLGRSYEAIIRINSQSGKGGVAYILQTELGLELPKKMHPEIGNIVSSDADKQSKELSSKEVCKLFENEYLSGDALSPVSYLSHSLSGNGDDITITANILHSGEETTLAGEGNGPINAFVNALEAKGWKNFTLLDYRSHAIGGGSATKSAAYILVQRSSDQKLFWGCGIDTNIEKAGLRALVSAFNRSQR